MRAVAAVLSMLALGAGLARAEATAESFSPAVTAADVDLPHCGAWHDGKAVATEGGAVLRSLGVASDSKEFWSAGAAQGNPGGDTFWYVLAFVRPVAVGSILCEKRDASALARNVFVLKADAPYPPDPADRKQWEAIDFPAGQGGYRLAPFPAGFKTRAVLTEETRSAGVSSLGVCRLLAARLYNAVPAAGATGPSEYTIHNRFSPAVTLYADNIINGSGPWQNNGPDDGVTRGPAITEFDPCWFVVQWDEPQTLRGLWLDDNFSKLRVLAWAGPDGINPVIGNADEWQRTRYEERVVPRDGGRRDRWVAFDKPVRTRAIKLLILGKPANEVQIARLNAMHALVDLGDGPAPHVERAEEPPPFKIVYDLPQDGTTTVAIDGPDGRRVRNLFAREPRAPGRREESWDLKDEGGRPVPPGKYTLKVLTHPGLHVKYELTPYPNIEENAPQNSPWLNGESGPGGWLADHTSCTSVCAAGDRVYIGAPVSESGVSLIECDLSGRKLWGHGNFLAWTGPHVLAADEQFVYVGIGPNYPEHGDFVFRVRIKDKQVDKVLDLPGQATRKRGLAGIAARDGKVYLSVRGGDDAFANAAVAQDVDLDHCVPPYPKINASAHQTQATWVPDKRAEFVGMFRMAERVPGHRGLLTLETARSEAARQHVVLAFTKAVPIGSLVFPMSHETPMRISLLKDTVAGAPDPNDESQWQTFWQSPKEGNWTVVPAPKNAVTRALRLSFARVFDELEDATAFSGGSDSAAKDLSDLVGKHANADEKQPAWSASIDGMKILRRRFESLLPGAKITVNSGSINDQGEWDARRTDAMTAANPGVYCLQWPQPQSVRGLAIKEIDGRLTLIDAWTGPEGGPVDLKDDAHWKQIATYRQQRRMYGAVEAGLGPNNDSARYIDGYVDFGSDVATRGIRLRVVEQWATEGNVNATSEGVRIDRGGTAIDPARCRIYGVAPVRAIGGEAPVDPLVSDRIEEWDTAGGTVEAPKLVAEAPLPDAGHLAFAPDGTLYGISANQVVQIDMAGRHKPLVTDLQKPVSVTADASSLYVLDMADARKNVRVYDRAGKFVREIGTPGGYVTGAWDPRRIDWATAIAIDKSGQLWHTESSYWPKRAVCWNAADGTVKRQFLGNTQYGGGGILDPHDKRRFYYGPLEFEIDWATGKSALKNLTWIGSSTAGEIPAYVNGRQYMLTPAGFARQPDGGAGTVYLYENGKCRAVAAMGNAHYYPPFLTPEFQADYLKRNGNKPLAGQKFIWTDANGDGQIQADEVQFSPAPENFQACYFDTSDLSLGTTGRFRYEVKQFLPSGVPVYQEKAYPNLPSDPSVRTASGNFVVFTQSDEKNPRDAMFTPDGKEIWGYRNDGFGDAFPRATPWTPGKVVAEFDVIGHAVASGGLGEFYVTNENAACWNVYSADGLLAGWIFPELRNPVRRPWSMPEHSRGMSLDNVTVGQEHFQGYFCKTADGKYYVVAGHNHASIAEVLGLDDFKREQTTFDVLPKDLEGLQKYDHALYRKLAYQKVKVLDCYRKVNPLSMDGHADDWKDQPGGAQLDGVRFKAAYDEQYLYVLYDVQGKGPLKNAGNDWAKLFRTGACVDLQIGTDPAADPRRDQPARGDQRVLISTLAGKPIAVLYQAVAPSAPAGDRREFHTGVQHCAFDRVVRLDDAVIGLAADGSGYVVEAAIPLSELGLAPTDGLRLKLDWGVLQSGPAGNEVLERLWWSNKAPVAFDEAAEARLHPDLWGYVRFSQKSRSDEPDAATGANHILQGDPPVKKKPDDIEDELEKGAVK